MKRSAQLVAIALFVVILGACGGSGGSSSETPPAPVPTPDTTPPVITLIGNGTIDLFEGDTYIEQGATAIDNVDGDISASIVIGGDTVDTNTVGSYVVTYNVSDAAGNNAVEVVRTVNVNPDVIAPVITLNGTSSIALNVNFFKVWKW